MNVFKELFISREERSLRKKQRRMSNTDPPPIATDVELIVDHSVWQNGKEKRVFGQGPLYLVIDGDPDPKPLPKPEEPKEEPKKNENDPQMKPSHEAQSNDSQNVPGKPEISQEQIKRAVPEGFRTSGLSVFRIGKGMNFLAPCYMGMHFMKQGKFLQTFEGKRRMGKIMMALLFLSYLFLIIYLPKSNEINESEMITGHHAQLIYLAAFLIGFFGWWYGKKTTANRVKLLCFDRGRCDMHDIHVGIFTCAKYTPEQQIAWWTNKTIPIESIEHLNRDLMKQNRSYQREVVKLQEDVVVYRNLGLIKAIMLLIQDGFLMKDDTMVLFYRRATFLLSILIMLLSILWYIGGG